MYLRVLVCLCTGIDPVHVGTHRGQKRVSSGCPRTRVTGGCKLPDVDGGNQTGEDQVLLTSELSLQPIDPCLFQKTPGRQRQMDL